MNGRVLSGLTLAAVGLALVGCPKKETAATDAASSAAPVASSADTPPPAAEAANESDVKRHPDDTKIDHVNAQVAWYVANVRADSNSGASLIAVLKKGTDTVKIASKDNFYLVTFTEPSAPGRKLMGWIDQKAYTPQIWDASKHYITCTKPQIAILLEAGELCVTPCSSSNDTCPTGQVCDGDAPKSNQGSAGDDTEFCRIGNKKGNTPPTPTTTDAGTTPTTTDAGTTPVADAGTKTDAAAPNSARLAYRHAADAGACNVGFFQAGGFCRFKCTASTDCPANAACKSFNGTNACADGL